MSTLAFSIPGEYIDSWGGKDHYYNDVEFKRNSVTDTISIKCGQGEVLLTCNQFEALFENILTRTPMLDYIVRQEFGIE